MTSENAPRNEVLDFRIREINICANTNLIPFDDWGFLMVNKSWLPPPSSLRHG